MGKRNKSQQRAQRRSKLERKRIKKYSIEKHLYKQSNDYRNYNSKTLRELDQKIIKCIGKIKILCAKNVFSRLNKYNISWGNSQKLNKLIFIKSTNIINSQNYVLGRNEKIKIIYSLKDYKSKLLIKPFYTYIFD